MLRRVTADIVTFNWADWAIVIIVLVSALLGYKRGLIKEALSLANWVVAVIVAVSFRASLSALLVDRVPTASVRELLSFAILFVISLIVGALVNHLVSEFVKITGLSSTDRALGAMFGVVRGLVIVMAFLILLPPIISVDKDLWWSQSTLIPVFLGFEGWAKAAASQVGGWLMSFLK